MPAVLSCSVVIPVLNDARVLERCLVALASQDLAPLEVIVVDNGSTDDSAAVAAQHGVTLLHEAEPGIAAASARGYDAAAGELILRLDADSRPGSDWISRVVDRFAGDADLDALTGPGEFTAVPVPIRRGLTEWYWVAYFERLRRQVGARPLFGSNFAMRATAWQAVSGSVHRDDVGIHDDLDLSIHLVHAGKRLLVDPRLQVTVSTRPLLHPFGMLHRIRRTARTLALHTDPPRSTGAWVIGAIRRAVVPPVQWPVPGRD